MTVIKRDDVSCICSLSLFILNFLLNLLSFPTVLDHIISITLEDGNVVYINFHKRITFLLGNGASRQVVILEMISGSHLSGNFFLGTFSFKNTTFLIFLMDRQMASYFHLNLYYARMLLP